MTPEAVRANGAPWLLPSDTVGSRMDVTQWPMPGFGHFIIQVPGVTFACVIPAMAVHGRGAEILNAIKFVAQLSWKDFEPLAAKDLQFATLPPGRAMWVPYGWRCVLMARDVDSTCHALRVPYVCAKMAASSSLEDDMVTLAKVAMSLWAEAKNTDSGFAMSCEALAWLEKVSPIDDRLAEASSSVTFALRTSREGVHHQWACLVTLRL